MTDLLSSTTLRGLLATAILVVAIYGAYHLIMALRAATRTDDTTDSNIGGEFEEMRLAGDINEEELRSIKAVLDKRS